MGNNLVEIVKYGSRTIHSKLRGGTRKYVPKNLDGCVLYLPMDEKTINLSLDHSGLNNHGTIYGAVETDGKINKGLSFDGIDDYVDCGNVLDVTNKLTIMGWVNFPLDCYGAVVSKWQVSDIRWHLWIDGNGSIYCTLPNNGYCRFSATGLANTWIHLTMVYDGTLIGNENRMKAYVNGIQKTLIFPSGDIPSSIINVIGNLQIGKQNSYYFKGKIDEVKVYNRALTEQEIITTYQQEL